MTTNMIKKGFAIINNEIEEVKFVREEEVNDVMYRFMLRLEMDSTSGKTIESKNQIYEYKVGILRHEIILRADEIYPTYSTAMTELGRRALEEKVEKNKIEARTIFKTGSADDFNLVVDGNCNYFLKEEEEESRSKTGFLSTITLAGLVLLFVSMGFLLATLIK